LPLGKESGGETGDARILLRMLKKLKKKTPDPRAVRPAAMDSDRVSGNWVMTPGAPMKRGKDFAAQSEGG
jgi:hypothetical protein